MSEASVLQQLKALRPSYDKSYTIQTTIKYGTLMKSVVSMTVMFAHQNSVPLDEEELEHYIQGLIWMRVQYVRGLLPVDVRHRYRDRWVIPSLVSVLIQQIGKAYDEEHSIKMEPITALPAPDLTRMTQTSQKLRILGRVGLAVGECLPTTEWGSYDFMTTCVIENIITAIDVEVAPINAFFCALTENEILEDIFSPRLSYGHTNRYAAFVESLVFADIGDLLPTSSENADGSVSTEERTERASTSGERAITFKRANQGSARNPKVGKNNGSPKHGVNS